MRITKSTESRITALRGLLEREKARIETKMTEMREQGRPQFSEDIDWYVNMCWKDTSKQIEKGKVRASEIISDLQEIKGLLTELPASNRATIQPSFLSLCSEASTVTSKITECIKMDCDESQRRVRMCFHELATTLQPSS